MTRHRERERETRRNTGRRMEKPKPTEGRKGSQTDKIVQVHGLSETRLWKADTD